MSVRYKYVVNYIGNPPRMAFEATQEVAHKHADNMDINVICKSYVRDCTFSLHIFIISMLASVSPFLSYTSLAASLYLKSSPLPARSVASPHLLSAFTVEQ